MKCGRVLRGYVGRRVCPTCWRLPASELPAEVFTPEEPRSLATIKADGRTLADALMGRRATPPAPAYRITAGGRSHHYATEAAAEEARSMIFDATGILVGVERAL